MRPTLPRPFALAALALLASPGCGGELTSPATSGTRSASGHPVRGELRGVNLDPENTTANPSLGDLRGLGATRVRFTFRAGDDLAAAFARQDGSIAAYHQAGLAILLILDGETVPLADRPVVLAQTGRWDAYVARFADRAARIAAHYQGTVDAYEIWNEEDLDDSLPGRHIDAPRFGELMSAAWDAIHAVSSARVVTGGLASGDAGYVAAMGPFRADAIATHPYLHWPGDGVPPGFYPLADHVAAYGRFGRPLWFTEWGTNDPQLLPRLVEAFFAHPELTAPVEQAFFFGWSDAQDPGYGLTTDGATHAAGITIYCAGQSVRLAKNGSYSLEGIAPGSYGLAAVNNWNETGWYDPWMGSATIAAGGVTDVDIALAPAGAGGSPAAPGAPSPSTGSVRGAVYDGGNGAPIHPHDPAHPTGVTVYCAGQQVALADDGSFEIGGIDPGDWGIAATNNTGATGCYATYTGTLHVDGGGPTRFDIHLAPR